MIVIIFLVGTEVKGAAGIVMGRRRKGWHGCHSGISASDLLRE